MKNTNYSANEDAACGAIESQVAPFIAGLKREGYAYTIISTKHAALRRFLKSRRRLKRPSNELDEAEIAAFMARPRQRGKNSFSTVSRGLLDFLEHLRRNQVIPTVPPKAPETISSKLERRYADFLSGEKGLADLSLRVYLPVVGKLFCYLQTQHGITSVGRLDASILRNFLFEHAQNRSSQCVRLLTISLRSFLRFLHAQGETRHDLSAAIPTVRKWTQPGVPKKLTPDELDRVLEAPDRATAMGRRDYAILLLLARLGLRAGEVILLELEDIHWRTGEILIRGKGGRKDLLPLPHDVGVAIARYLRLDRGSRATQRIFLRTRCPRVPLSGPTPIGYVVRRAMEQARVERPKHIAAHLFRHTLASRMLQQGANLRDITEVLRHRAPRVTEIYAKIDMRSLKEVVRPWPAPGGVR
ncbi:MAG TPA: tyrosine-type recombinase/integrase [Clostridia bacterium]|nr:tyrosine-type recombinase/integrase [Clostridia bacterium]